MDEHKTPILELPERSAPKVDLDDLMFRGEGWLASDREGAVHVWNGPH